MPDRLSIVEVVEGAGVELRRAGRDSVGLCPFHAEKTPSFNVNEEKNLFYCFGCGTGGDSIDFIRKLHRVGFKQALKILNLEIAGPTPETMRRREKAKRIAEWAGTTSRKINDALLDIGDRAYVCREALKLEGADQTFVCFEIERLRRCWEILCDIDDDLNRPQTAVELWTLRNEINAFVRAL